MIEAWVSNIVPYCVLISEKNQPGKFLQKNGTIIGASIVNTQNRPRSTREAIALLKKYYNVRRTPSPINIGPRIDYYFLGTRKEI